MKLDDYDIPISGIGTALMEWTAEAVELRFGTGGDSKKLNEYSDETPAEAVEFLRAVRKRADRVGGLLQAAKRARGRARRALAAIDFDTDNDMTEAIGQEIGKKRQYESHKDREVAAKLATFEARRTQYEAKRLVSIADEAVEVINDMHWSLDAIRKDIRSTLMELQFESSLER